MYGKITTHAFQKIATPSSNESGNLHSGCDQTKIQMARSATAKKW